MKAIVNSVQKGGVGKTTVSVHVARILSEKFKTVLVDGDHQGNSTTWLIPKDKSFNYELADVLKGNISIEEALYEVSPNFYLLPTFSIGGELKEYRQSKIQSSPLIFKKFLNKELEKLGFEYAIYDTHPDSGPFEAAIIAAADEVVAPLNPEVFGLEGLQIFNAFLKEILNGYETNVKFKTIICNNLDKRKTQHKDVYAALQELDYSLYVIPTDADFCNALAERKTLFDYNKKSHTIPYLENICQGLQ